MRFSPPEVMDKLLLPGICCGVVHLIESWLLIRELAVGEGLLQAATLRRMTNERTRLTESTRRRMISDPQW